MKLSVPPESIDWVMELLLGERRELEASRINGTLCAFHNNHSTYCTCPRWMASSPVLVSSLESPSGLKTIYGCKDNQKGIVQFVPEKFFFPDVYQVVQIQSLPLLPQSLLLFRT